MSAATFAQRLEDFWYRMTAFFWKANSTADSPSVSRSKVTATVRRMQGEPRPGRQDSTQCLSTFAVGAPLHVQRDAAVDVEGKQVGVHGVEVRIEFLCCTQSTFQPRTRQHRWHNNQTFTT